jgi:SH3-like domain-containing protein
MGRNEPRQGSRDGCEAAVFEALVTLSNVLGQSSFAALAAILFAAGTAFGAGQSGHRPHAPMLALKPAALTVAAVAPTQTAQSVAASTPDKPVQTGPSGLPVPRWVSLKAGRVNVRQGPSPKHAILWTYVREGLPVEVIAEFDTWRRIRDQSGETGWVRQQLISGRRTVVVTGSANVPIVAKPEQAGNVVALAAPGLVAELQACAGKWCEVSARGYDGFVPRDRLWGVYAGE